MLLEWIRQASAILIPVHFKSFQIILKMGSGPQIPGFGQCSSTSVDCKYALLTVRICTRPLGEPMGKPSRNVLFTVIYHGSDLPIAPLRTALASVLIMPFNCFFVASKAAPWFLVSTVRRGVLLFFFFKSGICLLK